MVYCRRVPRALLIAAAAVVCVSGTAAHAQCLFEWTLASAGQPSVATDPGVRQNHMAAYDAARGNMVVFGGFRAGFGYYGDTWTWDGLAWMQASMSGPVARSVYGMAYDSARQRVVLFGGSNGTSLGDTWEWDGVSWTELFPAVSPPARFNHAMAFDSVRNVVVMTGGFTGVRFNDTWEYDGATWMQRTEPGFTNYLGRNGHAMGFDPARNRMVIFGGFGGSPLSRLSDTWELGPTGWVQIAGAGPSGRQYTGGLTYVPEEEALFLFGGQLGGGSSDRANDLWKYDGAWTQVLAGTPAPTPVPGMEPMRRDQHSTVYDAARQQLVVFGGYFGATNGAVAGDTWTGACASEGCYANCDGSTIAPILNVDDFTCFINEFALASSLPVAQQIEHYANCDGSQVEPVLNVDDFTCYINQFAIGCP
jgi:hypothetical protein